MAKLKDFLEYLLLTLIVVISVYARFPARVQPYLWLDEAWRAVAIELHSSFPELISYMSQSQEALLPSEWILGRVGLLVFGKQEIAFRYAPLLFSSITLLVAYALIEHVTRARLAVLAPLLFGSSYLFVRHARHFKPYSLDLFLTISALWAATLFVSNPSRRRYFFLLAVLSLFALSSLPALFVVPGIVCYLAYHRAGSIIKLTKVAGIPLCLYGLNYLFLLKPQSAGGALKFWSNYYLDDISKVPFLAKALIQFVDESSFVDWRILLASYFIALPIISIHKKDGFWILLISPLFAHMLVSSLRLYPLFDRPSIYLYGLILISFAYSASEIGKLFFEKLQLQRKHFDKIAIALITLSLVLFSTKIFQYFEGLRTWPISQGRESFQKLAEDFTTGDRLRFGYGSYFTLKFYGNTTFAENKDLSEIDFHRKDSLIDKSAERLCEGLQKTSDSIEPGTRVWFVSTHAPDAYRHYQSVLPQVGDVRTHVAKSRESLVSVVLEKPFTSLDCSVF